MRVRKFLLVFAAFALIVAACGDDDGAETTEATTATTAAPATTEAPVTGVPTLTPGVLSVSSDISFPPFEEYDDSGVVVGFDADLVNEIGKRLDLEVEWVDSPWDTIFTNLAQAQFDIVASGVTIKPDRAEIVNFSMGYFNSNQALTVNHDLTPDINALADLKSGDSVAVQVATTGADWALENLAPLGIEVREFPQAPDTYNALEGGQVTGVIFDVDSAIEEAGSRPGLAVVAEMPTGEVYGIAVNPENLDLLAAINATLTEMIDDGFYQTTYDTWFDKPEGSINFVPTLPTATPDEPVSTLTPGVLSVSSDISFPPFEEYDDSGVVVGFDADLVNEIGKRLDLEVEWVDSPWDTIFTNLAQAQFDIVASGVTIKPDRAEIVNFSMGYFNSNQALTVNHDLTPDINALADLKSGDSVAVQVATTGADWALENLAPLGIEVREFPQAPDTYNALEGGQVTGVIFDVDSAIEEAGSRPGLAVVAEMPTGEVYGIAVNPENLDLLAAINATLTEMIDDGFYQTTYDTWFDKPEGSINFVPTLPTG